MLWTGREFIHSIFFASTFFKRFCLLLIVSCEVVQYVHITDTIKLLSWTYLFHWNPVHGHHIHLHSWNHLQIAPVCLGNSELVGDVGFCFFFVLEGRLVCGHQTCWIEVSGWKTESTPWCHHIPRIKTVGWRDQSSLEGVVHGVWMKVKNPLKRSWKSEKVVTNRQFERRQQQRIDVM